MTEVRAEEIAPIVESIRPLLAGKPPELQGAVLADLLAIWLAGHHVAGDEDATRKIRAELLAEHCFAVRQLTSINAKIMGTTP
jgi:hypothetical protein